jgi:pimeloyl-ACP methyl ester carboxylesterase
MPRARVGSIELCWESIGEGDPLLLVMGIGAQLVHWPDGFCAALADRGFRVIRFDNRDVGESTRFDHLRVPALRPTIARWLLGLPIEAPYGLHDMADDTARLLDALDVPTAHVVGASMGGMIAQLLAIRHPRRVRSLTSIMSHPGDRLSAIPRPRALKALLGPLPRTREQAQDAQVQFFRIVGSTAFDLDEADARERAGRHFDRGQSPAGFARQMLAILAASDRRPALRQLDVPAAVVHGSVDPLIVPRGGYQTAKALRNAEYVPIVGMGHDLPRGAWPFIVDAIDRAARRSRVRVQAGGVGDDDA